MNIKLNKKHNKFEKNSKILEDNLSEKFFSQSSYFISPKVDELPLPYFGKDILIHNVEKKLDDKELYKLWRKVNNLSHTE